MRFFRPFFPAGWLFPEALFRIISQEKTVYLTFDDGPDPVSTPGLLDILDSVNVKAVFFCRGEAAEKYPELTDQIKQRGHILGNHGYYHLNGWKTSSVEYFDNAAKASPFTSSVLFRPPYGQLRISQYSHLKKTFKIVFWDIMCYDFDPDFGAVRSLHLLKQKLRPGSIIVLHDSPISTCRAFLKNFLEDAISKEYAFEKIL